MDNAVDKQYFLYLSLQSQLCQAKIGFSLSGRGNLPLHFQESTTSESGSIENVSGNSIIPSVNPLGISPVLSGSVETFPRTTANPTENDGRDGNRTSESSTNSNITVPEIMRNRAASTGSVLSGRRDSAIKGNDDHNRTMVFQVQNIKMFFYLFALHFLFVLILIILRSLHINITYYMS